MNTHKITFGIATLAFFATTSSVFLSSGCSSSTSPSPTLQRDASEGDDSSSTKHDSGGKPEKDGGKGKKDAETSDAGEEAGENEAGEEGGETTDAPVDTGPTCESDATTCNSCTATDLYNVCSTYTKYCVPFDKTRVPAGAVGKL
jgi:hypothetical protein